MRILQVSPSLPVDVCVQAACLSDRGYLHRLYTSTAINGRSLGGRLIGRWLSRREVNVERGRLKPVYSSDVRERLTRFRGGSPLLSVDERFERVDRAASRGTDTRLDAVLCREDAADHTFQRAGECGVLRLYDLPIAHFESTRRLLSAELEEYPELEASIAMVDEYSPGRTAKKRRELRLADGIVCPSSFVRRSLVEAGIESDRIRVIPFGCNPVRACNAAEKRGNVVLGVGQISVRKGSHRLLEAWKRTGAYRTHTLRLIGGMHLPRHFINKFKGLFQHVNPLQRDALGREFAAARFCVVNSLSEGMAIVIGESLSAATPVVASRNSGAEEIVTDGEEGILVDYADDDALANAIDTLLGSPPLVEHMSERAAATARMRTWEAYAAEFVDWLEATVPAGASAGVAQRLIPS